MNIGLHQRPKLSRAARLRADGSAGGAVLLSRERGLRLNATATAVVQRCTGVSTVGQIVDELRGVYAATEALDAEVSSLLSELYRRRLSEFESRS